MKTKSKTTNWKTKIQDIMEVGNEVQGYEYKFSYQGDTVYLLDKNGVQKDITIRKDNGYYSIMVGTMFADMIDEVYLCYNIGEVIGSLRVLFYYV